MNEIPITNPMDYFEFTTNIDVNVWQFVFRWNQKYSLFHVDIFLNGISVRRSIAVLGGVFLLPNFSLGYNFLFFGVPVTSMTDLGITLTLNQIDEDEAIAIGLIKNDDA